MSKNVCFSFQEYLAIFSAVEMICNDIQAGFSCPLDIQISYFGARDKLKKFLCDKGLKIDVIRE